MLYGVTSVSQFETSGHENSNNWTRVKASEYSLSQQANLDANNRTPTQISFLLLEMLKEVLNVRAGLLHVQMPCRDYVVIEVCGGHTPSDKDLTKTGACQNPDKKQDFLTGQ